MKDLKNLMGELLGGEGMEELRELLSLKKDWKEIAGAEIAGRTKPYRLEDGRLYVGVESHPWAQELHYRAETIKERIKRDYGIEIKEIVAKKINLK